MLIVRPFLEDDVPELLNLMHSLAVFEGYRHDFQVTEPDLIRFGLSDTPLFYAFVARSGPTGPMLGMAVTYFVPYTFDLRPNLVLKELYVTDLARGQGVGAALFNTVRTQAAQAGCARINWTVLADNQAAGEFYHRQGGQVDSKWRGWTLPLSNDPAIIS